MAVRLLALAVSLLLALALTILGIGTFSGGSGNGSSGILTNSKSEQQIKLCAEGRDSSYGEPPSQAQQAACLNEIAKQAGGDAPDTPTLPSTTLPGDSVHSVPGG